MSGLTNPRDLFEDVVAQCVVGREGAPGGLGKVPGVDQKLGGQNAGGDLRGERRTRDIRRSIETAPAPRPRQRALGSVGDDLLGRDSRRHPRGGAGGFTQGHDGAGQVLDQSIEI